MKQSFNDRLLSNPLALAGIGVMSGKDLGIALNEGAVTARQHEQAQAQKAQFEQQQRLQANIGDIMQRIDPNDLQGSFAELVHGGIPPQQALGLVDSVRKQQAQTQNQELLSGLLGGGGMDGATAGNGMGLMAAGALTGNTGLSTLGSAINQQQQQNRAFGAGREDQAFSRASKLSNDFQRDSAKYIATKDSFQNMLDAASEPSGAGDVNMVYGYMKMLDPTSVVREGEAATAENAGGISAKVRNSYNKIISGEKLNPSVRQDFIKQANNIYNQQAKSHKTRIAQYSKRADSFGLSPDMVISDFGTVTLPGQKGNGTIDNTIENVQTGTSLLPKGHKGQSLSEIAAGDQAQSSLPPALQNDPRVLKARQAGYSDAEIMQYMRGQ